MCLLSVFFEIGMKMSSLDVGHIVRNGNHLFNRLLCEAIYDCPARLGRYVAIPFNELSNDFIIHIDHFINDIPNQRAHRAYPNDDECRGHHYLEVNLLKRGQRGYQGDELASQGPQRQHAPHDRSEI